MDGKYLDKKEILIIADQLEGTKFKDLKGEIDDKNKGAMGLLIESDAFGVVANTRSEADFILAGYELKVTPVKKNKNGTISAKERLVLNIINFMKEELDNFEKSSFWLKNEILLILFYLFEADKPKEEMYIIKSYLNEFSEVDLKIIKNDWKIIVDKIKNGLAHEISEADTMYLGACTKGANSDSLRLQPNSEIKAMQRAYSLKASYMTQLVRKIIGNSKDVERIIQENSNQSFEEVITNRVKPYIGKTKTELCSEFGIVKESKNINEIIISRIFGLKGKISNTDEFSKANIRVKTVRIEKNGFIKESMSFPAFNYKSIVNSDWYESELREMFETTKFMFVVFENNGEDYFLKKVVFWNMPIKILEQEVRYVWMKTKKVLMSGEVVKKVKNGKTQYNFPGLSYNSVAHVRPHGKNKNDVCELPIKDKLTGASSITKHCFWLNNTYIKSILDSNDK